MVQTVTWLSGLPKEFAMAIRASMPNAASVRPRRMTFLDIAFILFLSSAVS